MTYLQELRTQPRELYILSIIEMFERFAFFGVRSLLILYMTGELLFSDQHSFCLYGTFMALTYATSILGAVLCDLVLGKRHAIILGSTLMCIGYGLLALNSGLFFYGALCFLAVGSGFFKPNIMAFVGSIYPKNNSHRDAGFTLFYVAINIGGFIAPLLCGYIGFRYGWTYAFLLALSTMATGLILMIKEFSEPIILLPQAKKFNLKHAAYIVVLLSIPLSYIVLIKCAYMNYMMSLVALGTASAFIALFVRSTLEERKALIGISTLMVFSIAFFALYEQAGSSLTLFAERNVDRQVFGFSIPTGQLQSLDPAFIILLGPLFAQLWIYLSRTNRDPFPPIKFALGLFQVGLGFIALVVGIKLTDSHHIALSWLILAYLLHTSGELCISPVGLSMITKLAPKRIVSMTVSLWFLVLSFGHYVAGFIAQLSSAPQSLHKTKDPAVFLPIYEQAFLKTAFIAFILGGLLFCISFKLKPIFEKLNRKTNLPLAHNE